MKKIVFLIPSLGMGGMERVLVNYVNILVNNNYDVTVLNFTHTDNDLFELIDERVHYFDKYVPVPFFFHASLRDILKLNFRFLPWLKWIQFHSAKYLHKKYIKEKFDIEVGFCGSPAIKIVSGAESAGVERLAWIHGENIYNDIPQAGGFKKAKKIYGEISKIICVSDVAVEDITKVFDRKKNIYKLVNPNDTALIKKLANEKVDRSTKLVFVCVGRIVFSDKGFDRVMRASSRLKEEGYDFETWFIGDGIDMDRLKNLKESLGVSNAVIWGQQKNPYKYMKSADVVVCPSIIEAYGMVVSEALILGKPVISTNTRGPVEILNNGEYGMVVDNSDDGVYLGMKQVLSTPGLLKRLQEKAYVAKNLFDSEKTIKEFEAILSDNNNT